MTLTDSSARGSFAFAVQKRQETTTAPDSGITPSNSPGATPPPPDVTTLDNSFPTSTHASSSPSPQALAAQSGKPGISSTVLMWIFAVIAVGLLASIMIWRYVHAKYQARRRHRGGSSGLGLPRSGPGPGPAHNHIHPALLQLPLDYGNRDGQSHPIILSSSFLHSGLVPLVHRDGTLVNDARHSALYYPHQPHHHHHHQQPPRVRGADVDEGGRRGGGGGRENGSSALEDLPAYEAGKSPPGYHAVAFTPNYAPLSAPEGDGGVSPLAPQSGQVQPPPSRPASDENGSGSPDQDRARPSSTSNDTNEV